MLTRAKASEVLSYYGLEKMLDGAPVRLYHGTTAAFDVFEVRKSGSRPGKLRARAVFLTPVQSAAMSFAYGPRNAGLDPVVVDDLFSRNPRAGVLLRRFVQFGDKVWDTLTPEKIGARPGEYTEVLTRYAGGVDPQVLYDLSQHVRGSRSARGYSDEERTRTAMFALMGGGGESTPSWVYDDLAKLGLDARLYGPKAVTVRLLPRKVLVTASKNELRHAPARGYDTVVYVGDDIEEGVPEILAFDPSALTVEGVEYGIEGRSAGRARGKGRRR